MAADDYLLSILATFKDSASPGLKKLGQSVVGVGKETAKAQKPTQSLGASIMAISGQFLVATQAAGQVVASVKKFYEFGKAGAVVAQTEASFDGLIEKLGATPDLLDDLRDASSDTVSDMELMSATTMLLAGAQGELATEMADATPELLEIAKAANKLNPALGTTTQLYQSLALGIKRSSPLRLDDLGLTIKIGEANKVYAESIGKTVEQLTAEEQQLALLAETRRAGTVLIEQAGGAADSATDDFARLETATENISNALKKRLAPAAADVAGAFADMLTYGERMHAILDRAESDILDLGDTYEDYVALLVKEAASLEYEIDARGNLVMEISREAAAHIGLGRAMTYVVEEGFLLRNAEWESVRTKQALIAETLALFRATDGIVGVSREATQSIASLSDAELDAASKLSDAEAEAISHAERLARRQKELRAQLSELSLAIRGPVGGELRSFAEDEAAIADETETARGELRRLELQLGTMGRGTGVAQLEADLRGVVDQMHALGPEPKKLNQAREAAMRDLEWAHVNTSAALKEEEEAAGAYGATSARVIQLRGDLADLETQMHDAQVEHGRETESIIYNLAEQAIASSGMLDDAAKASGAVDLQWALAGAWGMVDEATLDAWAATEKIMKLYEDDKITLEETVALYEELAKWAEAPPAPPEPPGIGKSEFGMLQWEPERPGELPPGVQALYDGMRAESDEVLGTADDPREAFIEIEDFPLVKNQGDFLRGTVNQWEGDHHAWFYAHYVTINEPGAGPGNGGGNGDTPPANSPWSRQLGGSIDETGWYYLHQNELVIPPMEAQQMQQGGGTTIAETNNEYNLNVTSVQEMTSLMQEFELMRALAE